MQPMVRSPMSIDFARSALPGLHGFPSGAWGAYNPSRNRARCRLRGGVVWGSEPVEALDAETRDNPISSTTLRAKPPRRCMGVAPRGLASGYANPCCSSF